MQKVKTNPQSIKIVGRVTYGNGLGRLLGFPTANIDPCEPLVGVSDGVWAGSVRVAEREYVAVVNVGYSPSVVEGGAHRVEAHIVGFEGDLYGATLTLNLCHHLRSERRFASREALVEQIGRDRDEAVALMKEQQ